MQSSAMLILSNNLIKKKKMRLPKDAVLRVNIAWVPHIEELKTILSETKHDIFLDYPQGRTKPPRPRIPLEHVLKIIPAHQNIKYFAVSNIETPGQLTKLRKLVPEHIELIPKIESEKGIKNLKNILRSVNAKHIMLDKEDLYTDIKQNGELFEKLVEQARVTCTMCDAKALELQGVVFSYHEA